MKTFMSVLAQRAPHTGMTTPSDGFLWPLLRRTKVVSTKTHCVAWTPHQMLPTLTNQNAVCQLNFCSTRIRNFLPKAHLCWPIGMYWTLQAWDSSALSQETQGAGWTWPSLFGVDSGLDWETRLTKSCTHPISKQHTHYHTTVYLN